MNETSRTQCAAFAAGVILLLPLAAGAGEAPEPSAPAAKPAAAAPAGAARKPAPKAEPKAEAAVKEPEITRTRASVAIDDCVIKPVMTDAEIALCRKPPQ